MSFDNGSFPLTVFRFYEDIPENILELFSLKSAGKLDDVKAEPQTGWVSGRHLLERRIDEETSIFGNGYLYLNLRNAQRKIPSSLLKAECRMEELAYSKATGNLDIPRKVKKEIKKTIEEKRLAQVIPSISGIPMVLNQGEKVLFLGATSQKQIDLFCAFFMETLKIKLIQINIEQLFFENKKDSRSYKKLNLANNDEEDLFPGRDFLTWLWFFSEEEKGEINIEDFGGFYVTIDGPLCFMADGKGALESVVKKGNPLQSAEAQAALKVGKKLKKAKIIITRNNQIWSSGFDADMFAFSSLSLPEGEEMNANEIFTERMENCKIFILVMKALFSMFLIETDKKTWHEKSKKIVAWAEKRESF